MTPTAPYFSIITPMYNRQATIGRAIESCLYQGFPSFELLIVDDASSDDSVKLATAYRDPRIRVLLHDRNRGPGPARNTAIEKANSKWCVMLDSDFALLPGALENLYQRTQKAAPDVGNVASSCLWDSGQVTPLPSAPATALDYCGYLRWSETVTISEYFNCVRREALETIRYPDCRAWEFEFHINLARRWRVHISPNVIVKIYTDATNRLTTEVGPDAIRRVLMDAPDKLASFEAILQEHEPSIRKYTPNLYVNTLIRAGHQAFLSGQRQKGLYYLTAAIRQRPRLTPVGVILLGLLGPRISAWATVNRRRTRVET